MTGSITIDIVISLVFVYLLYSLLVTVVAEIISTYLALRARNLKEAVDRMLNDEAEPGWAKRLAHSVKIWRSPDNEVIRRFYSHPEIKYLGSAGLFKNPSSFKAVSFSKTLIYLLNCNDKVTSEEIDTQLRLKAPEVFGKETAEYVLGIWEDSKRDVVKFKLQLEAWFDRTMEQATDWYKRKIQIILFLIGFLLAWIFNVDTLTIVKKLSIDQTARTRMVEMASSYLDSHPSAPAMVLQSPGSSPARSYQAKLDSVKVLKGRLDAEILASQTILGAGSWPPDVVLVKRDKQSDLQIYTPLVEGEIVTKIGLQPGKDGYIRFTTGDKLNYFFRILAGHWSGILLTALALSLGAPFWFDLLNKVMKLRSSVKQPAHSTNTNRDDTVIPSNSQ